MALPVQIRMLHKQYGILEEIQRITFMIQLLTITPKAISKKDP